MTRADKARIRQQNGLALEVIHAKRVAAGVCRHCGGPVPCYSEFGDQAVGRLHTKRSLAARRST